MLFFIRGERKICSAIKKSKNIMNIIVASSCNEKFADAKLMLHHIASSFLTKYIQVVPRRAFVLCKKPVSETKTKPQ